MKKNGNNPINIFEPFKDYNKDNLNKLLENEIINTNNFSLLINKSKEQKIIFKYNQKLNQQNILKKLYSILINSFGISKNNMNEIYKFKFIKNNKQNKKKLRIFGDKFIQNNKKNCKLIINGKQKELKAFITYKNINYIYSNIIKIKLKFLNKIKNFKF